jgi:hypothetical protein
VDSPPPAGPAVPSAATLERPVIALLAWIAFAISARRRSISSAKRARRKSLISACDHGRWTRASASTMLVPSWRAVSGRRAGSRSSARASTSASSGGASGR